METQTYHAGDNLNIRYDKGKVKYMFIEIILISICPFGVMLLGLFTLTIIDPIFDVFILFDLLLPILLLSIAFYIEVLTYRSWCQKYAVYFFLEEGLMVDYPLQKKILIPWSEFEQICIIYKNLRPKSKSDMSCICFVKKGQKRDRNGRWKIYDGIHYKDVFTTQYKKTVYEGLKERCTQKIVDERKTTAYKYSNLEKLDVGMLELENDYKNGKLEKEHSEIFWLYEYISGIAGVGHEVYLDRQKENLNVLNTSLKKVLPDDLYAVFNNALISYEARVKDDSFRSADEYINNNQDRVLKILEDFGQELIRKEPERTKKYIQKE